MKKLLVIIVLFLLIGGFLIIRRNSLDVKQDSSDRKEFLSEFTGWILKLGSNIKDVTSYTAKKDWLPEEENKTVVD
jgi:hypothetical protein